MDMNMKTGTYYYNDESYNFEFSTDLSVAEKLRFVNSVVDLLVDENHYNSVIRDIIFDYFTVKIFTTIDTSRFDKSDTFLDDVEDFILSTNIVEIVQANALPTLFDELNTAVDKSIAYLTGIHPSPLSDALASIISTLEKKINEVDTDSMMGMAKKFAGMGKDFTIENVIKAYMESDVHKQNLAEIANAKSDSDKVGHKNEIKIDENLGEAVRSIVKENKVEKIEVVE
jgi:hypothetical protein